MRPNFRLWITIALVLVPCWVNLSLARTPEKPDKTSADFRTKDARDADDGSSYTPVDAFAKKSSIYSIQIGAYESAYRARIVRSILGNLTEARIESTEAADTKKPIYRVLVGKFDSPKDAEKLIDRYGFRKLFPDLWVNAVQLGNDSAGRTLASTNASEEELDPYRLNVNLHCEKNRKMGQYQAQFKPEPGEKANPMAVDISWACYPNAPADFRTLEQELRPSYFSISPVSAFGTLSGTNDAGDFSRSGFGYGVQIGFFKNFGPIGPVFRYRILRQRYANESIIDFRWRHSLQAGAALPVTNRLVLEPSVGLATYDFLTTATGYESKLLPDLTLRGAITLFEPKVRTMVDLLLGFQYLFGSTSGSLSVNQGWRWSTGLRTRAYTGKSWASDWSIEYSMQKRDGATIEQSENALTVGVSFLLLR